MAAYSPNKAKMVYSHRSSRPMRLLASSKYRVPTISTCFEAGYSSACRDWHAVNYGARPTRRYRTSNRLVEADRLRCCWSRTKLGRSNCSNTSTNETATASSFTRRSSQRPSTVVNRHITRHRNQRRNRTSTRTRVHAACQSSR